MLNVRFTSTLYTAHINMYNSNIPHGQNRSEISMGFIIKKLLCFTNSSNKLDKKITFQKTSCVKSGV